MMNKLKFAGLAVGLLLTSSAFAGSAPSESAFGNFGSGSLNGDRHTVGRVEALDSFLKLGDIKGEDGPRPSPPPPPPK
jgi:hypothetical protein